MIKLPMKKPPFCNWTLLTEVVTGYICDKITLHCSF